MALRNRSVLGWLLAEVDFAAGHADVESAQQGCTQLIIPRNQLLGTIMRWSEK